MKKRWISAASESETESSAGGSVRAEDGRLDDSMNADEPSDTPDDKMDQPKQMPHFVPITENEFADDDV